MLKKMIALLLSLCLVGTMIVPTMAGTETAKQVKTAVFLGDSLSAGFQMGFGLDAAYDYSVCLTQDKTTGASNYYWAYPFRFGELVYGEDEYAQYYDKSGNLKNTGIAYDKSGTALDNEVQQSVFNYGISGAQSEDMRCLLSGEDLPENSAVNMLRQGFIDANDGDFYAGMVENVKNSDMTVIAVGGNDIYQNFANDFQLKIAYLTNPVTGELMLDPFTQMPYTKNLLGYLFYMVSNQLMMAQPMGGLVEMFKGFLNPMPYVPVVDPTIATETFLSEEAAPDYSGGMGMMTGDLGAQLLEFLAYYSKLNIAKYFTFGKDCILNRWETSYQGIVDQVAKLQKDAKNENGQIVLVSQYNPFGAQNYLAMLEERLNSDEFMSVFHKEDARTVARIVRTLMSKLTSASVYELTNPSKWQKLTAAAFDWALEQLLPKLDVSLSYVCNIYNGPDYADVAMLPYIANWKEMYSPASATELQARIDQMYIDYANMENWIPFNEGREVSYNEYIALTSIGVPLMAAEVLFDAEDNDALYDLLGDLSYPMMVAIIGRGLQPVYDKMNEFIKGIADKSDTDNIVYVDISDAPSNGRFDPHPGVSEHTWIADHIYEQLVEINGGTAFKGGNYKNVTQETTPAVTPEEIPSVTPVTTIDWLKLIVKRTLPAISALMSSEIVTQTILPTAASVLPTLMALTGTVVAAAPAVTAAILSLPDVDLTDTPAFTALMALTEVFLK